MADAGYGLVLAVITGGRWRRLGGSASGQPWRVLLASLSGTTVTYGVMTGSYFGLTPEPGDGDDYAWLASAFQYLWSTGSPS